MTMRRIFIEIIVLYADEVLSNLNSLYNLLYNSTYITYITNIQIINYTFRFI